MGWFAEIQKPASFRRLGIWLCWEERYWWQIEQGKEESWKGMGDQLL